MTYVFCTGFGVRAIWKCVETNVYVISAENGDGCIAVQFVAPIIDEE